MPKIDPSIDIIKNFRTPLNDGEKKVLNYLYMNLSEDWEIYVQPPMNKLNPDIVLIHPENGVAVVEVKDWSNDDDYWHGDDFGPLFRRGSNGKEHIVRPHPLDKILNYRAELKDILIPSAATKNHFGTIHSVLVFPSWDRSKLNNVFTANVKANKKFGYPRTELLRCADDLSEMSISEFLPFADVKHSSMNEQIADDLRFWVCSSEFDKEQTRFVRMNNVQSKLVQTRTTGGFRRIKGAAGTGKSVVLAARAAELERSGKKTILIYYNITLGNYLRDLAVRYDNYAGRAVGYLHYHGFLRRIYSELGFKDRWRQLFSQAPKDSEDELFKELIPNDFVKLLNKIKIEEPDTFSEMQFDAILVDEGQDFNMNWWNSLRLLLRENGEMILAADPTQDIYDTAIAWTDELMAGAGFSGGWVKLEDSYRLPTTLQTKTNDFAKRFLPKTSEKILAKKQLEFLDFEPAILNWKQIDEEQIVSTIVDAIKNKELNKQISSLGLSELSMKDIVILAPTNEIGRQLVHELSKHNINVLNTFDANSDNQRRQKIYFFKGAHEIKATTIQSYKGLESRALIIYIPAQKENQDYHSVYAALTRLKGIPEGSILQVYCSDPNLKDYGKTWQGQALHRQMNPTVKIAEQQVGIDYSTLFSECLSGSERLTIQDGYIFQLEQFLNLEAFIKTFRNSQDENDIELYVHLKTRRPSTSSEVNNYQHDNALQKLKTYVKEKYNVNFSWEKNQTVHDRSIQTNNGWFITLGRGLDIFKRSGRTNNLQELPCRECIITFRKEY